MTEKLYYLDSHLYEFQAKVIEIIELNKETLIVLDKTAFFPEGGGQKSDEGYIKNFFVYDVSEKNGIIYHHIKSSCDFFVNETVNCCIDNKLRFSRMQAHSGEHIVSGIAHNLFYVENVGFHMDGLLMTVDFDKYLSKEQISQLEIAANQCIYENRRITAFEYSAEELKNINYRSKLEFEDSARIVSIDKIDKCACCAPHVSFTGEVGLIKILSTASHRGGIRITMICGFDAYMDYISKYNQIINISTALCAKHDEADIAVEKLIEQNTQIKNQFNRLKTEYLSFIADTIAPSAVLVRFFYNFSMDDLRELSVLLSSKCDIMVVTLSGSDDSYYSYCIYSDKLNLQSLVKQINNDLCGTGGGRGNVIQGKFKSTAKNIMNYFMNIKVTDYENA